MRRSQLNSRMILLVDDDADVREFVSLALQGEGYEVATAADGHEALERLGELQPGLILLDMKMPRLNGFEFVRLYREREERSAPIIVLTAAYDARLAADTVGADAYLSKPFDVTVLLQTVERFLGPAVA